MEVNTLEFLSALLSIVIIDLVIAGDNAIVIGLIAKKLPKKQQKKAIFWGTVGAVIIRTLATLIAVWLLKIPGLLLVGGILVIWIAFKLVALTENPEEKNVTSKNSLWTAIRAIIIADIVISLDNVLAVAGASHGSFLLVFLGLLISIPIVIFGSSLFIIFVDRFPFIIYIGGGVIAWTAAKMIMHEPLLKTYFLNNAFLYWGTIILIVGSVLLAGKLKKLVMKERATIEDR
ncbi:YjbE family putative metal transport protein [Bacillus cereus]|uniref:YjbE family putative metal transport protein n=1 Tax=Bacillus cereus TaxID=1396 RepID=UPI00187AAF3B|nr:YjbE family putative metal transport protein [Bacillus cereus]MBE7106645.1 YjbE family putative metal transport protein [Bacillus cereus]